MLLCNGCFIICRALIAYIISLMKEPFCLMIICPVCLLLYKYETRLIYCVYSVWGSANIAAFNVIVFLMVASHLRAVLSDPGTVPLPKTSLDFSDMHSGQKMSKVRCMLCVIYDKIFSK